MSTCIVLDYSD